MILSRKSKITREELLESLAEQDTQILALAYAHAQYLKMYGVDIEKALYTATENAEVMTRAYQKGYYDAMKQKPQTGHWLMTGEVDVFYDLSSYECSKCGQTSLENGDYCPNCGARMVEPQESEKV